MKTSTLMRGLAGFLAVGAIASAQLETPPAPSSAAATPAPQAQVDLNTAEIPALEALPEIGTTFANAIVSGRPYKSVDDMARAVKLPPEKLASLRPKVFVSPPKAPVSTPPDPRNETSKPASTVLDKATSAQEVTERYDRAQGKTAAPKK